MLGFNKCWDAYAAGKRLSVQDGNAYALAAMLQTTEVQMQCMRHKLSLPSAHAADCHVAIDLDQVMVSSRYGMQGINNFRILCRGWGFMASQWAT